jgi:cell division protein ZapA (FtsZ GTPase activity inhibitor)
VTERPTRVEVELLGQRYTIRSEASPDYVSRLVRYVEDKIAALGGDPAQDPFKRLALVTLYLADELFRARDEQARAAGDVNARVDTLIELLDQAARPTTDSA